MTLPPIASWNVREFNNPKKVTVGKEMHDGRRAPEAVIKMASPLEIGAQGTIGTLISHEVEYFRKVDLGDWKSSQRIKSMIMADEASASNSFKLKESDSNNVKKKKKKEKKRVKEGKYLPSICSAIEISENTSRKENRMFLQKHQVDEFREEKLLKFLLLPTQALYPLAPPLISFSKNAEAHKAFLTDGSHCHVREKILHVASGFVRRRIRTRHVARGPTGDLPTNEAYYEIIVALNPKSNGSSVLRNTNTRVLTNAMPRPGLTPAWKGEPANHLIASKPCYPVIYERWVGRF
ncbi:hypothetical protein IEQ34_010659 [Dendrobium chrysotoxum]|uniref:Uncharacterized protein n=1 Tax=Dendrobium chrysotoxum TaxID=161865 RepID=A0AAV7GVE5_DENCH|nr:hypothetical protein IEQ34_010659 [Dendrobium chrysotoxum]